MTAFNVNETVAVIRTYPDDMLTLELIEWFHFIGIPRTHLRTNPGRHRDVCAGYNRGIKYVALKTTAKQFIFADNDMRPNPKQTASFLEVDADVVACEYQTEFPCGESWPVSISFHTGLWRCHRTVLETIKPPWFWWDWTDDGCEVQDCPCQTFANKVLEAGFTVRHGGWAKHEPKIRR